jgi:hypothetical protein
MAKPARWVERSPFGSVLQERICRRLNRLLSGGQSGPYSAAGAMLCAPIGSACE